MTRPSRLDWALAGLALVTGLVELALSDQLRGPLALNVLAVVWITLPVAWWRSAPLPATAALFAGALLGTGLTSAGDFVTIWFCLLALSFGLGAHASDAEAAVGLGLLVLGVFVANALDDSMTGGDVVFPLVMITALGLAGRVARSRARLAGELHEAVARAKERRAAEAELAVAEERRRIAREMHDVVAHSVSVMVVQAGGARRILERDPARAEDAARLIAATGREAIAELQRLLGVLHVEHGPTPTLEGLDGLVERARAAGLPVELAIEGERRTLPAGVELAAYRVLQEAITNAIRYAGGAPTDVRVRYAADEVQLHVRDRGRASAAASALGGGGHGLVGMRERVRVFGGELESGRCPDGGFEVRARIPVGDPALR